MRQTCFNCMIIYWQLICPRICRFTFLILFSFFFQTVSVGRRRFSANFQLIFRLIKFLIFMTFVSILITLIALPHMTVQDIVVCFLAFLPTGWGMLLVCEITVRWTSLIAAVFISLDVHVIINCIIVSRLPKLVNLLLNGLACGAQSVH